MNFAAELNVAREAARLASDYLVKAYQSFTTIENAPADISTEADKRSQDIIFEYIHSQFPHHAISGEESTDQASKIPRTGKHLWIVDPIDGTRGFARKNGQFSVMIAYLIDGEIKVGIVAEPALARVTYAALGSGCWKLDGTNGLPEQCLVSQVRNLDQCTLTQSHSKSKEVASIVVQRLQPRKVLETYSAGIKLAQIARGEADVYLNDYLSFRDWDIAAGHLLVTEAGGLVTDLANMELKYGLPGAKQETGLLATNGLFHDEALAAWQKN